MNIFPCTKTSYCNKSRTRLSLHNIAEYNILTFQIDFKLKLAYGKLHILTDVQLLGT